MGQRLRQCGHRYPDFGDNNGNPTLHYSMIEAPDGYLKTTNYERVLKVMGPPHVCENTVKGKAGWQPQRMSEK